MIYRFFIFVLFVFFVSPQAKAVDVYGRCMDSIAGKIQNVTAEQLDAGCTCVVTEIDNVKLSDLDKDNMLDAVEVCFEDTFKQAIGLSILNECMDHPKAKSSAVFRNICRCVAKTFSEEVFGFGMRNWLDSKHKDVVMSDAKAAAMRKCKR